MIEADPNRPPTQERVLFPRHVEEHGKLVASEVEGPDDDGRLGKGLRHVPIGLILFLLPWQGRSAHHEEFGSEKADTASAMAFRLIRFPWQVEVRPQGHGLAILGDGFQTCVLENLLFPFPELHLASPEDFPVPFVGIQDDPADPPIEDGILTVHGDGGDVSQAHHGRQGERAGKDDPVRRSGAPVRGNPMDLSGIKLHRHAGREVLGHQDDRMLRVHGVEGIREIQDAVEQPGVEIFQVIETVQGHWVEGPCPHGL